MNCLCLDGGREWAGTCFLVLQAVVLGVGSELRPQLLTFVLVPFPLVYPSHLLLLLVSQRDLNLFPSLTSWHLLLIAPHVLSSGRPLPQGGQRFFEHNSAVLPPFASLARPAF